jgi:hypothetical protein
MTKMKTIRILFAVMFMIGLSALAIAQSTPAKPASATGTAPPPRITAADARNHISEMVMVCGKVVDTKVSKYGLAGRGKPVSFDIDTPEPNPVFFFVAFGAQPGGPEEAVGAYNGRNVCVTGKITVASGVPYIMAADRAQVKVQASK